MSEIKARIVADIKSALKAKEKQTLQTLRAILGSIKNKEIDERIELDDTQVTIVIQKMAKQRKESITQFEKGARIDLVEKEQQELAIIDSYLPKQMSENEISIIIENEINKNNIQSIKQLG